MEINLTPPHEKLDNIENLSFEDEGKSLKTLLGVNMGSYREYKPGKWKVKFYYEKELHEIYTTKDSESLRSEKDCVRTLIFIEELIKNKQFNIETWRKAHPLEFERAVDTWINAKEHELSYGTLAARKRIANNYLIPYFKTFNLQEIGRSHVQEFKASLKVRNLSDKSIYNVLGELHALMSYHLDVLPKFPTTTVQDKPIKWLTEEQQDQVFEFIPDQDKAIFMFQRYTGCRPNEVRGLLKKNVMWDKGIIIIASVLDESGTLVDRTKTKRVRVLPIIPEIESCLKPRDLSLYVFNKNGFPYIKRTHERIWHTAMVKANKVYGIPIVSMYPGTKHSLGMKRLQQGYSKDVLQALFGHRDRKSTDRYAKYLVEGLAPVMRGAVIPLRGADGVQEKNDKAISS